MGQSTSLLPPNWPKIGAT